MHRIYFDGGTALSAICYYDETCDKYFVKKIPAPLTNNQLEYAALLEAVNYANGQYGDIHEVVFVGDSELIIKQMKGENQVRKFHLKELFNKVKFKLKIENIEDFADNFLWVPRDENKAGIYLENLGKQVTSIQ